MTDESGLKTNRDWRRLWSAQAISLLGDYVFDTTVVLWVGTVIARGQSWAPVAVSAVLIAAAVPTVVVGPIAGVFVDRWSRKRVLLNADLLRAVIIALLFAVPALGTRLPVWAQLAGVYLAVASVATVSQFFNPSRFAAVASVVAEPDRAKAFSLTTASANAAAVLGPPLAAPLLFTIGVGWSLAVNVASFLTSYALIRQTAIPHEAGGGGAREGFLVELREGWSFTRRSVVLSTIAVSVFLYMFGVGAVNVLEIFFASENLKVDPRWLGTLNGALGVGSIVGALLAGKLVAKIGDRRLFAVGILATGLLVLGYSRLSSLAAAVVVLGCVGIPLAAVNAVIGPMIMRETPNRMLGRINAVLNPLVYLASVSSMAIAGLVASSMTGAFRWRLAGVELHRIDTIFAASSLLMVIAGIVAIVRLRRPAAAEAGRRADDAVSS